MRKITYMGRTIYDRDSEGKFSSLKTKILRFIKRVVIAVFVLSVVAVSYYGVYIAGAKFNPDIVKAEVLVDNSNLIFTNKIEELKDGVIAKLRKCEGGGYADTDGLIVFDTNKKASIGLLQFQVSSVVYYYKTLYGQVVTPKEAILIALDSGKSAELAKKIMFETPNKASKDWYNCSVRLGLDREIDLIKSMQ